MKPSQLKSIHGKAYCFAARLQARAVDAAPKYGAPQRDEEE
jgi:hypothetical protein